MRIAIASMLMIGIIVNIVANDYNNNEIASNVDFTLAG